MIILSSIFSDLEFWSVNHTSLYENSELKLFWKMKFLGGISNNWPNLLIFLLEAYCFMSLMLQNHAFDDTEYNPSGNSNFLFHFGSDI